MPQLITALPKIGKVGAGASGVMGIISNLIRGQKLAEAQKAAAARQKELAGLIADPALLAQKVSAMEQPLNKGLVQGVENQAQAGLMERGLGTSPQIANQVFAQALGPYEQENRMAALRSVLQLYGIDDSMINTMIGAEGQPIDTSGLWAQLQGKPSVPTIPPATPNYPPSPDMAGGISTYGGEGGGAGAGDYGLPGSVPFEGSEFPGTEGLF